MGGPDPVWSALFSSAQLIRKRAGHKSLPFSTLLKGTITVFSIVRRQGTI